MFLILSIYPTFYFKFFSSVIVDRPQENSEHKLNDTSIPISPAAEGGKHDHIVTISHVVDIGLTDWACISENDALKAELLTKRFQPSAS